jgi:hypothetical protein
MVNVQTICTPPSLLAPSKVYRLIDLYDVILMMGGTHAPRDERPIAADIPSETGPTIVAS